MKRTYGRHLALARDIMGLPFLALGLLLAFLATLSIFLYTLISGNPAP